MKVIDERRTESEDGTLYKERIQISFDNGRTLDYRAQIQASKGKIGLEIDTFDKDGVTTSVFYTSKENLPEEVFWAYDELRDYPIQKVHIMVDMHNPGDEAIKLFEAEGFDVWGKKEDVDASKKR